MKELSNITAQAAKLLADRAKIQTAITTAEAGLHDAQQEAAVAKEALAAVEAENALSAESQQDGRAARKRLAGVRENLDAAEARVRGLEARMAANTNQLADTRETLIRVRAEVGSAQLDEVRARILEAVARVRDLMREALAIDAGLRDGRGDTRLWFQQANFPSPSDFLVNLLQAESANSPAWHGDQRLTDLAFPAHQEMLVKLERELSVGPSVQVVAA